MFLQFGFLFPNISFRYRGTNTKTFSRLEPKTSRIRTAEREASRCRSFDFTRYYAVSAVEKATVAFFAVAVNLQRRRRTRVCSRRLGFLKRFSPSAVVAHFAKPSFASIVLPPIVWHYGRRCFFRGIGPRLKHNTFDERLPFRGFESGDAGTRRIGAKPNVI